MRANKMCGTCPFRGADEDYKRECAHIPADAWPCHSEALSDWDTDIQCRGHFEARRKYPVSADAEQAYMAAHRGEPLLGEVLP